MDFFGEIGRLVSTVTGRGREDGEPKGAAETLEKAQNSLKQRFAELGSAYFAHMESGVPMPDGLLEKVREAADHVQKLMALQQRQRCPACGSAQEADAKYCSQCGRPMPEREPEAEEAPPRDAAYCPECGALLETDGFCPFCGRNASAADAPPPPPAAISLAPVEEPGADETENE